MDNSNFQGSIWKYVKETNDDDWKLFFNYSEKEKIKGSSKKGVNEHQVKLSDFNSKKNLILGTLVMTPSGIGKLTKQDKNVSTVKLVKSNEEHNFEDNLIQIQFPVYIRILDKEFSNWHKVYVLANSNVDQLKKTLEEKKIVPKEKSFTLVFNGLELKDEAFFDQLDLRPESKILLYGLKSSICKVERYLSVNTWWYTYQVDGVTFNVNKKIRLSGLGMYGSHEGKTQNGTIYILEGNIGNSTASAVYEEVIEVPPSPSQSEAIVQINFRKAVAIKPNQDYTIQFRCTNYCYLYYGSQCPPTVTGDKNVVFSFKFTNNSSHGSNAESGNFPVFYYLA